MSLTEIGERLRQRREELGVSLQTAQAATKIRLRYLQALEAGDDSVIPGYAYAKGFLRIYANFLGLDGDALLVEYRAAREGMVQAQGPARQRTRQRRSRPRRAGSGPRSQQLWRAHRSPSGTGNRIPVGATVGRARKLTRGRRQRQRANMLTILVIVVLLAVAVVAAYFVYLAAQQPVDDDVVDNTDGPTQQLGSGEPAASDQDQSGVEPNIPAGDEPLEAETSPPAVVTVEAVGETVLYNVAASFIEVAVRVTDRCWVRVESDGTLVTEQTLTPGMTVNWEATGSLRVRAGNPAGLHLTVNENDLGIPSEHGPRTLIFELTQ